MIRINFFKPDIRVRIDGDENSVFIHFIHSTMNGLARSDIHLSGLNLFGLSIPEIICERSLEHDPGVLAVRVNVSRDFLTGPDSPNEHY